MKSFIRFLLSRRVFLALGTVLLLSSCGLTTTDVRLTVDQANYEMLAAEAEPMTDVLLPKGSARGQPSQALARLDAFEQQHKDNPTTLAALQLRRALLHLNNNSYELSRAAFDQIAETKNLSARDRALFDLHDTMLWWWPLAQVSTPGKFAPHQTDAVDHQKLLLDTAAKPDSPSELRDYLLEMRAWIGIKLALDLANHDETKRLLEDAVNQFGAPFTPAEHAQLAVGIKDVDSIKPFDISVRRVLRAQAMIEHVASRMAARQESNRVTPSFKPEQVVRCYETALKKALNPDAP